jgi:hypothetical protein
MKRYAANIKLLLLCCILLVLNFSAKSQHSGALIVEQQYQTKNGLISSYGNESRYQSPALLESIGQYMEYLLLTNNGNEFQEQFEILKEHFTVSADNAVYLKWKLGEGITTNASVDDYRIISVLTEAGEKYHVSAYTSFATTLWETMARTQLTNGLIVDFYDWSTGQKNSEIHLNYLNYFVLEKMQAPNLEKYKAILVGGQTDSPFFQEIYNPAVSSYQTADEDKVNMIDQFLIAIQFAESTKSKPANFHHWLQSQISNGHTIYGGYIRSTGKPAVTYESSAVYALGVLYSLAVQDQQMAKQFYERLKQQEPLQPNPDFTDMHFFDFMYVSYAKEKYEKQLDLVGN